MHLTKWPLVVLAVLVAAGCQADDTRQDLRPPLVRARTREEMMAAQKLVQSKLGWVHFQHVRKAGGTSVLDYIAQIRPDATSDWLARKSERMQPGVTHVQQWEFQKLRPTCLAEHYNDTVHLSVVRHPVCRAISEFFYVGFRHVGLTELFEAEPPVPDPKRKDGLYFVRPVHVAPGVLERAMHDWMDERVNQSEPTYIREMGPGCYRSNLLVRHFGGGICIPSKLYPTCDTPPSGFPHWSASYCNGLKEVQEAHDLETALFVLRQFDLVLITEWLADTPELKHMLDDILLDPGREYTRKFAAGGEIGNGNDDSKDRAPPALQHQNSATYQHNHTCRENPDTGRFEVTGLPLSVVSRLFRENELDIRLYYAARTLAVERIRAFRTAKQQSPSPQ